VIEVVVAAVGTLAVLENARRARAEGIDGRRVDGRRVLVAVAAGAAEAFGAQIVVAAGERALADVGREAAANEDG
jgi:hypothetical protein